MKGLYPGPMTIDQFFQALYQDRHAFFEKHAGKARIKKATLYVTFCDEQGRTCDILAPNGVPFDEYLTSGAYNCAADLYEALDIEPTIIAADTATTATSTTKSKHRPKPTSSLPFNPF